MSAFALCGIILFGENQTFLFETILNIVKTAQSNQYDHWNHKEVLLSDGHHQGMRLECLSDMCRDLEECMVVVDVEKGSYADLAGIQPGFIIRKKVGNLKSLGKTIFWWPKTLSEQVEGKFASCCTIRGMLTLLASYTFLVYQYVEVGMKVVSIDPFGNCAFGAVSDQLLQDSGKNHRHYRKTACDYIEANSEDYCGQLFLSENAVTVKTYLSRMRIDGEWAGNEELAALSKSLW